jgi:peptidoglycan/LPS O-acetylase OafA/YrhL
MSNAREHILTLDGLRGCAALIVVISHCANAGFLPIFLGQGFGQMGVALFYALSGLLMGRLYLWRSFERDELTKYAWRRGARVLPLYFSALLLGVLFMSTSLSPYHLEDIGDVLRAAFLLHGTGVLWSIPVEIQFYVVFVGIWWAASRGKLMTALIGLFVFQTVMVAGYVLAFGISGTYTLLFWLHFFLFGTLLGHLTTRLDLSAIVAKHKTALTLLAWVLLIAVVIAPPGVRVLLGIPKTMPFVDPVSGGYPLMLLVVGLLGVGPMKIFAWSPLRWLGKVSFSVYLLHMPVLVIVEALDVSWITQPWQRAALVFLGTFIVSAATERWIESGAQSAILRRYQQRSKPAPTASAAE